MRIVPSLVALIFLGAASAGVVPDIARRDVATADGNGGKGGQSTSMSGVHLYSSGFPTSIRGSAHSIQSSTGVQSRASGSPTSTGNSIHSTPSSTYPHSPAYRRGMNPSYVHSVHPISRRADPTGSLAGHSTGSRPGTSGYPTPSAGSPASRSASTLEAPSSHPVSGGSQPTEVQSHYSGSPSGISGYPKPTTTTHA